MDIKRYTKSAESSIYDPFDGQITNALTPDEAEVLRLYQMQDLEGRTEILHAAYEQKKRLAQNVAGVDRGEKMAAKAKTIIEDEKNAKEV